jgi:hypothetical protein
MSTVRRFRAKDMTQGSWGMHRFIAIMPDGGPVLFKKNGSRVALPLPAYSLDYCLKNVAECKWVELPIAEATERQFEQTPLEDLKETLYGPDGTWEDKEIILGEILRRTHKASYQEGYEQGQFDQSQQQEDAS